MTKVAWHLNTHIHKTKKHNSRGLGHIKTPPNNKPGQYIVCVNFTLIFTPTFDMAMNESIDLNKC